MKLAINLQGERMTKGSWMALHLRLSQKKERKTGSSNFEALFPEKSQIKRKVF